VVRSAAVGAALGTWLAWASLRRGRRPFQTPTPSIAWDERPLPIWRQDRVQLAFIAVHATGIVALALLLARTDAPRARSAPLASALSFAPLVAWAIAGSVAAFPLLYRRAGTMPMRVFTNAVARGQYVATWSAFSHFDADAGARIVRLYSPGLPSVVRVAWHPDSPETYAAVVATLAAAPLPTAAPATRPALWRRRWAPVVLVAAITLALLAASLGTADRAWGGLVPLGAILVLLGAGVVITRRYQLD
jgi:hypothetical protein